MLENSIRFLINLTLNRRIKEIKAFLEEYDANKKGILFEMYLVELFICDYSRELFYDNLYLIKLEQ